MTGETHAYYRDFGSVGDLVKSLRGAYVYDGMYSEFRQRAHGRPIGGLSADHFVMCIHNHDQVGNRAISERLYTVAGAGKAKIGAAVVLLSPFVPMLFQGEEFAASTPFNYFVDFSDEKLAQSVVDGRKEEHSGEGVNWTDVPDPREAATMEGSKLLWAETEQGEHADMLAWYRALIKLRRERDELRDSNLAHLQLRFDEEEKWLVMERGGTVLVCNFSAEKRSIEMPGSFSVLMASEKECELADGMGQLPGESVVVLGAV